MNKRSDNLPVGEWNEGDGVDPREEKKSRKIRGLHEKADYSVFRLAGQIKATLDLVIPQCGDPLLSSFAVGAVEPSPAGGIFVVQVFSVNPTADYDIRQVKAALTKMKTRLRAEVAKDVTRKKAPDFKFDVLPPGVQPK